MTDDTDDDQPTLDGAPIPPVPPTEPAFEAPLPAADVQRCPACLSPVRQDQRYCLECGERLRTDEIPPPPGGGSALAERGATLLVVAAIALIAIGAGLSWVALREPGGGGTTTDAVTTATIPTDTVPVPTETIPTEPIPVPTETIPTDTEPIPTDDWPEGLAAWAVILASKAQDRFTEDDARLIAEEAELAGVPQTGVLDSSAYPTLNPGYWAVFAGPYDTRAEAEAAAATIRTQGFPEAYAREVAP